VWSPGTYISLSVFKRGIPLVCSFQEATVAIWLIMPISQGVVSRPGSVSGGWTGARPSQWEALLAHKLEAEVSAAEVGRAAMDLEAWTALLSKGRALEAQVEASEAAMRGLEQAMEEVEISLLTAERESAISACDKEQLRVKVIATEQEACRCKDALVLAHAGVRNALCLH